jgi:hypothetical protein
MSRLIEDGLFSASASNNSGFKLINYNSSMESNGIKNYFQVMVADVIVNPTAGHTFGIGAKAYTFVASGATGDQINIGATVPLTITNIIAKINLDREATRCSAYLLGDTTRFLLVERVSGYSPIFSPGASVSIVLGWSFDIDETLLDSTSYFLRENVVDVALKPVELVERNKNTKDNFLY